MKFKPIEVIFEAELLSGDFELEVSKIDDYDLTLENDGDYDLLLDIDGAQEYNLDIEQDESLNYVLDSGVAIISYIEGKIFDGPYTVIPSQEPQILKTNGYVLSKDITVGAIPSNYGLITWNGVTLTVS